jgi:hypothetical protein
LLVQVVVRLNKLMNVKGLKTIPSNTKHSVRVPVYSILWMVSMCNYFSLVQMLTSDKTEAL